MVTFYDFPNGRLGAPSHDEPSGITLRGPQASDRCRQALQEGRSGDTVIWKMLMVAEQRFRRLKAPELIEDVYLGAQLRMESPLNQRLRRSPPDVVYTPIDVTSAKLRAMVKRILRKHGYPPDKQEKATVTVLEQAEVLFEGWATA